MHSHPIPIHLLSGLVEREEERKGKREGEGGTRLQSRNTINLSTPFDLSSWRSSGVFCIRREYTHTHFIKITDTRDYEHSSVFISRRLGIAGFRNLADSVIIRFMPARSSLDLSEFQILL